MNPQEAFMNLLIAAMMDAATERKLTQLKTTISPDGKTSKFVRIIVVPEDMEHNWPTHAPLGHQTKDGQNRTQV